VNQLYRDLKLAVETLPIERILGYASNPHVHPDPQISVLERSLGTFGCVAPIITDEKNVIVAGHGVLLAAKK
jgi:ParB-like chromosome segregation protein Spo0J